MKTIPYNSIPASLFVNQYFRQHFRTFCSKMQVSMQKIKAADFFSRAFTYLPSYMLSHPRSF